MTVIREDTVLPTYENTKVSAFGEVTIDARHDVQELYWETIGRVSIAGPTVWIDPDGWGGTADSQERAVETLLERALAGFRTIAQLDADAGFEDYERRRK